MAADHALGTAYKMNVIFIPESKQSHSSSHETEEIINFLFIFINLILKLLKKSVMKYILENVFILYPSFFTFLAIYYSTRIENFSTHESWQHFKNVFQQNHKLCTWV